MINYKFMDNNNKHTAISILCVLVCMAFSGQAQINEEAAPQANTAIPDTLTGEFSLDELERFRNFYIKEITKLEAERSELRKEGIRDAETFLKSNPNSKEGDKVLMRLAELYYEQSQEDYQELMQEYDRLYSLYQRNEISEPPEEPNRDITKALDMYIRVIEDYPMSGLVDDAFYSIGFLFEEVGLADSAFVFYSKLYNEFPDSELRPDVLMRMGEYYFNPPRNKVNKAIEYYKKVLDFRTSPRYDEALYRLGWSYYRLNDYTTAISYFTLLADDVKQTSKYDPLQKYTNPSLVDESVEYIGLSFLEKGGTDAALDYLNKIGGRVYGIDILKRIGDAYMKEKEDYEEAIAAYDLLVNLYPMSPIAPSIQDNIVQCYRRLEDDARAYLERDSLFTNYKKGSDWWENNKDEQTRQTALVLTEAALRDNITFLYNTAQSDERKEIYIQAVTESEKYLETFPSDSSAPLIHWNMALTLDTKLNKSFQAYNEYMEISNLYWDSKYQRFAARNAVAIARDAAMNAIAAAEKRAKAEEPVTISDLKKEAAEQGTEGFNFRERMKLQETEMTDSEARLAQAYDNFIKLFPHEEETPLFLANCGALYYRHNQFRNALKYFKTLLLHFPSSEQVKQAQFAIMESYFGRADFKSSEIIARKIVNSPDTPDDIRSRAARRLAESIFLNAEMLAENEKHFEAGNEYRRMVQEAPRSSFADLALFNAALEFDKAKEFVRAIETYNYLLATHPNSGYIYDAQNNLAFDYVELKDFHNAALTYKRLATVHPDEEKARDALYNSSLYFARAEDWEDAIDVNELFLQRFPKDKVADDIAFEIANFYKQLDQQESAQESLLNFVSSYPKSPRVIEAFYQRGNYFRETDKPQSAIVEYKKALLKSNEFKNEGIDRNIYFAAESEFALAEVKFETFKEIQFRLPEANLANSKEQKKDLLLEIVRHLGNTVSYGTLRVYEATHMIGKAYQEFAATWADQDIPDMEKTRKIVAQKEVNDASRDLYERAAKAYRNAIESLGKLSFSYKASLVEQAANDQQNIDTLDVVEQDSMIRVAETWIDRSKDDLSKVNYEIAEISLNTAKLVLDAPVPEGLGNFAEIVYKKRVVDVGVEPLLKETMNQYKQNIIEADSFDIQSQWVELSTERLIETKNLIPNVYTNLAFEGLDVLEEKFVDYRALIFSDSKFDNVINTLQSFSDDMNNSIEFSQNAILGAAEKYTDTISMIDSLGFDENYTLSSKDSMMASILHFSLDADTLSRLAKKNADRARDAFLDTQTPLLEEGLFTFESNFFALRDMERQILETGYELAEDLNIDNIYAKNLTLQLVRFDPEQYADILDLKIETYTFESDTTWKVSSQYYEGWTSRIFDESTWKNAIYVDNNNGTLGQAIWTQIPIDSTVIVESDTGESVEKHIVTYEPATEVYFRKSFSVQGLLVSGNIKLSANPYIILYFNGDLIKKVNTNSPDSLITVDLSDFMVKGKNLLAIEVRDNRKDKPGFRADLTVKSLPRWDEKLEELRPELADEEMQKKLLIEKGRIP